MPLARATPSLPSLMPVVVVVPVGLIPAIKPGGGGAKPVVVVPVVGVVLVPGGVVLVPGGVVLVLLVVPVPAWLITRKQEEEYIN